MSKVLLISTGGTITMVRQKGTNALVPADIETFKAFMPELFASDVKVDIQAFTPLIDSSDIGPDSWRKMAQMPLLARFLTWNSSIHPARRSQHGVLPPTVSGLHRQNGPFRQALPLASGEWHVRWATRP